jgi:hypothetical protein
MRFFAPSDAAWRPRLARARPKNRFVHAAVRDGEGASVAGHDVRPVLDVTWRV